MVSIKAFAIVAMAAVANCQGQLYSCWCGPNQGTTRTACNAMADSGWMENGRCMVYAGAARDYFINTACGYGSGQEWCDTA